MALIGSSYVFCTSESILLHEFLNPSMIPQNIQKASVPFNDGELEEHGQNTLKYMNLVKETPQKCI